MWIDLLRGGNTRESRVLHDLMASRLVGVGDLVLHEVLRGIRDDMRLHRVRRDMLELRLHRMVTPELAMKAAEYYRTLRRRGITIRSTVDCLIATYCIENGYELLHSDRDYDAFETHLGLQVVRES